MSPSMSPLSAMIRLPERLPFFEPDGARGRDSREIPEGPAFAAWRLRPLSPAAFHALGAPAEGPAVSPLQLAYLAHLFLLAPTTHNTVPERFRLGPGSLSVWVDREAVLPASDPVGRQATISLGCGLENLALGARCLGLRAEIALTGEAGGLRPVLAGEPRHAPFAEVAFRDDDGAPEPLAWLSAMLARKVLRAEYDDRVRLPPELADELRGIAAAHPGLRLHLLDDSATLLFLGKFQELADTTVLNREPFARELGRWLHDNDSRAALGMRGREFGLGDASARHLRRGLLGEERLLPDEAAGFARAGNLGMRSASAVAVITVAEDTLPLRVAAGRAYQRMALALVRRDFHTAMHAAVTEVEAPNLALRGRLRTRDRPTVLFRIGRPLHAEDRARPHAARPPLAQLLLPDPPNTNSR